MLNGNSTGDIVLRNVSKRFGETTVLDDLSLVIHDKELLVLLGPSGCGKTTTLNLLAGLEQPTTGEIFFGDRLMNDIPAEQRDISMVFQSIGLYPHLNVWENITFPLRLRKVPRSVIDQRVEEIVEILGISRLLKRRMLELSGGERQRVAIAKALVKRPYLFLLDEPFSSLDADLRRQLRADIVRIHRQLDTTMVFVTHDQEEAMSVADRIVVMSKARLQQVGSPLDVHDKPANLWVAKFVGAHPINVMDCYWHPSTPELTLFTPQGPKVRVGDRLRRKMAEVGVKEQFILGIRPHYLRLSPDTGGGDRLPAEVFTRQVLGTQILYSLLVGGHELSAVVSSEQRFEPGARVAVECDWAHAIIFDKETELCQVAGLAQEALPQAAAETA